jgi:GNAT superfamily N-acetyltransferase
MVPAVADAVARGFQDNEIWAWTIPDERRRARLLPRFYRARLRHLYLPRGEAWTVPGQRGGAMWLAPGEPRHRLRDELAKMAALGPAFGLEGARRGRAFDDLTAAHAPTEPHFYLEVLSVDPGHQRSGYGAAMLRPLLERCDAERAPAYLETNRESNLPYYNRFGFELLRKVHLEGGPPVWLMWREPGAG